VLSSLVLVLGLGCRAGAAVGNEARTNANTQNLNALRAYRYGVCVCVGFFLFASHLSWLRLTL
jgi:hypothetical protein